MDSDREKKGAWEQIEKKKKRKAKTLLLRFCCFAGDVVLTAGKEGKRGGGCYRPPRCPFVFVAAREPTRRQWRRRGEDAPPLFPRPETFQPPFRQIPEAFPAVSWISGGLLCNFLFV